MLLNPIIIDFVTDMRHGLGNPLNKMFLEIRYSGSTCDLCLVTRLKIDTIIHAHPQLNGADRSNPSSTESRRLHHDIARGKK